MWILIISSLKVYFSLIVLIRNTFVVKIVKFKCFLFWSITTLAFQFSNLNYRVIIIFQMIYHDLWLINFILKRLLELKTHCAFQVSVLRLLRSVTQVKEEYQTLRQDILEVHQLQKQLSDSLSAQLSQVQGHFNILRNKIIGRNKTPQLK